MLVAGRGQKRGSSIASRTENSRNGIIGAGPLTGVQSDTPKDRNAAPGRINLYTFQHTQRSIPMYKTVSSLVSYTFTNIRPTFTLHNTDILHY